MLKLVIFGVLLIAAVSGEVQNNSSKLNLQVTANSTQQAKQQPEISLNAAMISEKNEHKSNEEGKIVGKGEVKLIDSRPNKDTDIEDVDDVENFKYYWFLLVFSSLSIIGIIVFKSFRYFSI